MTCAFTCILHQFHISLYANNQNKGLKTSFERWGAFDIVMMIQDHTAEPSFNNVFEMHVPEFIHVAMP